MLKIYARPSGIYKIRGSYHGVVIDQSARTRSRAEAEKVKAAWEKKIFAQVHDLLPAKQCYTFADAAESWLRSGGNAALYFYFEKVVTALASAELDKMTPGFIRQKAQTLFPTQKNSTINRGYFALVSVILNHAATERMMTPIKIKPLKVKRQPLDWHSPETLEALIAAGNELAPLLTFLIGTGARTSEAMRLEWDNISQDGRRVTFWATKANRPRSVDLCNRTAAALPPRRSGRVFRRSDGKPWAETEDGRFYGVKQKLDRICKRNDLPHIRPHSLRHSWASWQYALDPDPLRLMVKGGWSSLKMVENYAHVATPDLATRVKSHGWFNHQNSTISLETKRVL